uniref:Syntaxin-18_N domain-containing protein n=1 Tax=Steinernema glaseri TaxID=37863 RepID=A0A1I8AJL3_9BILA
MKMAVGDNTALFRARAKTIRLMKEARKKKEVGEEDESAVEGEKRAEHSPNYKAYATKGEQIATTITELRNLVLENRASYVLTMGASDSFGAIPIRQTMTDSERNQLDEHTDRAMKMCSTQISNLQATIRKDETLRADDEAKHLQSVCKLLDVYLKSVCQIITQMRTVRLNKTQSRQKLARLSTLVELYQSSVKASSKSQKIKEEPDSDGWESMGSEEEEFTKPWQSVPIKEEKKPLIFKNRDLYPDEKKNFYQKEIERNALEEPEPVVELTESERVQFAIENEELRQRFQYSNTEIEAIEKQFVELQRLQETFTEKVMDQEKDISRVNEVAATTVENIKDGNDLIRQAIKNSASRRVIFLFCLIVLTFTLLFLDWYNP